MKAKIWLRIISSLSLMMVIAPSSCRKPASSLTAIAGTIPPDTVITLERTECYGTCPSYKLTINADGAVTFDGHYFVKQKGIIKSNISQERLKQLISEFEKVGYFSLKDSYTDQPWICVEFATDNPSANTSIKIGGKVKAIKHYHGCRGHLVPKALTELENKIDEIVNTSQWISSEDPERRGIISS